MLMHTVIDSADSVNSNIGVRFQEFGCQEGILLAPSNMKVNSVPDVAV
jgi:hypothetical protein